MVVYSSAARRAVGVNRFDGDQRAAFDVRHYELDVSFDPSRQWLDGRALLRLRVSADAINNLTLRLAENLTVRSIYSNEFGRLLSLRIRGQNNVIVNLNGYATRGTQITLDVAYSGRLDPVDPDRDAAAPQFPQDQPQIQESSSFPGEPSLLYSTGTLWYPQGSSGDYATDWTDTLFTEAFADVPSWSVYEPAWQQKYLGTALPLDVSLRGLYGAAMLDVAWSLFELRLLRDPALDPNVLWPGITQEYLHIKPHPELSWWAVRVQLASPGYMVNYGLGSVLTAEMRRATAAAIGPFDAGNPRWHDWTREQLLKYGSEKSSRQLMDQLLGRPLSPAALLAELNRIK